MELRVTRKPTSCRATPKFANIFWNQTVHYYVHKISPLVLILNQTNPVYTTSSYP
jgi:hypothetical protein